MTDADSIAELIKPVVFPSTLRSYTVSYVTNYPKHDRVPTLILKGQWLEKAGFTPGRKLEVRVMDECIVLTAKVMEPTLEDAFHREQNLSKRKQQQIMELISMVKSSKGTFS
ncbi:toxic protein SymE [Klebsiella oxytoca]|uniref:Toxic protein SymE n=1 Tax=Klebsiella oxytoca TaxID=571 RepID=A0A318FZJ5_KLEOX|nr:SymE family type I addiction module toxin [Klebsiella oxytoca]PXW48755.1 toxic protein SymE [Klebsiella oxytoca]HCB1497593.1 SymE family type I addiction module toxin [Klebsiella michiganensis]HCB1844790.1 SymE family type I addiction module toxin [Klebsiella oxytoca]